MTHDLPPSNPDANDDNVPPETDTEPVEETPETKAHKLWQAALRGLESEWGHVSPSTIKDKIGAAIVASAFKDPKQGLHITFRRRPGEKRTPRLPWYKYSQNGDKEPDETP